MEAVKPLTRPEILVKEYLSELDKHIEELKAGVAERTFEIRDLAAILYVHPRHLSNTIKEVTGNSACYYYEEKLLRISKELILERGDSIASIAKHLMYDPSNFAKFFKSYTGMTPKQFRETHS